MHKTGYTREEILRDWCETINERRREIGRSHYSTYDENDLPDQLENIRDRMEDSND